MNTLEIKIKNKNKNYSTEYSHVVPHHSTDSAISCLTAQIGRDAVLLTVYGRNSKVKAKYLDYIVEFSRIKGRLGGFNSGFYSKID